MYTVLTFFYFRDDLQLTSCQRSRHDVCVTHIRYPLFDFQVFIINQIHFIVKFEDYTSGKLWVFARILQD